MGAATSTTLRSTTVPPVRIRTRIGQADRGAEVATRAAAVLIAMPSSVLTRLGAREQAMVYRDWGRRGAHG
eukprot:14860770-Alexandrium_andersonii.AAC.1